MKKITFILFTLISINAVVAQQKIESGKYITEDKLTYITILDENRFSYMEYYKKSPYTIEQERKRDKTETNVCGVVGYISNGKGEGIYQVENNQLKLKFTSFEKGINKEFDKDKVYKYFDLSKMIKI